MVTFWASWCPGCKSEMPVLESAEKAEHGRVRFLGIDSGDTRSSAISFLSSLHATYPSLFDPTEIALSKYKVAGLPTTIFISPTGKVLGRVIGELSRRVLRASLITAFGPGAAR